MNTHLEKRKRLFVDPKNSVLFGNTGGVVKDFVEAICDQMVTTGGCSDNFAPQIFEMETTPRVEREGVASYKVTCFETEEGYFYPVGIELGSWISSLLPPDHVGMDKYDELDYKKALNNSVRYAILSATLKYFEQHFGDRYEMLKDDYGFWYVGTK